ncbi:MAG: sigma-54 interaction domain-containing protein [Longimicrobiales bacterium]
MGGARVDTHLGEARNELPDQGNGTLNTIDSILGESEAAGQIRAFARRAASVDATVLITGESGTGKGLLARAIHDESARRARPMVAVNCASVPDALFESEFFGHTRGAFTGAQQAHRGLLEQADGGTLFLDEIAELSPPLQAKLLTAIEEREFRRVGGERVVRVNVRILAATSADLEQAVAIGTFRRDLYHRLMVLAFRLPALRERGDDIDLFVPRFLERFAARYRRPVRAIEPAALLRIRAHAWPGNIRQLANAIESAVLACDGTAIAARHLPAALLDSALSTKPASPEPDATTGRFRYSRYGSEADERRRIEAALRRWRGNKTRAAADLGMARNTLREKIRRLAETLASDSSDPDD